jgi:hypothetical protein
MSEQMIERTIRQAYKYSSKIRTQGDRVLLPGTASGMSIEMWLK